MIVLGLSIVVGKSCALSYGEHSLMPNDIRKCSDVLLRFASVSHCTVRLEDSSVVAMRLLTEPCRLCNVVGAMSSQPGLRCLLLEATSFRWLLLFGCTCVAEPAGLDAKKSLSVNKLSAATPTPPQMWRLGCVNPSSILHSFRSRPHSTSTSFNAVSQSQ